MADFQQSPYHLSLENSEAGLSKMSIDISKALIRKLATQGETFSQEKFRTLKATYYRIALDYVETYRNDAIMNGLSLDIHHEGRFPSVLPSLGYDLHHNGEAPGFLGNAHCHAVSQKHRRVIMAKLSQLKG